MRVVISIAIAAIVSAAMSTGAEAQTALPEITVGPPKSIDLSDHKGGADGKIGADGKSGDSHSFDRLNEQIKRKVDETNPAANSPPLDASSPDTKTGVVNIPGVQQQYGQNFGHSVVPFRPAPPVFTSPLGQRR